MSVWVRIAIGAVSLIVFSLLVGLPSHGSSGALAVRSPTFWRLKRGQWRRSRRRPRIGMASRRTRSFRSRIPCGHAKRSSSQVAIPIAQGNRPELLRQTPVPASPPRVLGPNDGYTGRRREGGRILNISVGSSILRKTARPNWRASARQSSSSRPNSHTNECPRAGGTARAPPSGCRRRRTCGACRRSAHLRQPEDELDVEDASGR